MLVEEGLVLSAEHDQSTLENILDLLDLELNTDQRNKLMFYAQMLLGELKRQRIIGEKTSELIINKQFYDSLYLLKKLPFPDDNTVLDLGSGGGFPGIPLKIFLPEVRFFFMDSSSRKIRFLKNVTSKLGLEEVYFLEGRAEDWGQDIKHRERYDLIVSKAVARMSVLAELALPLTAMNGNVVMYKGPRGDKELIDAEAAITICGGQLESTWRYGLPTGEERALYIIRKLNPTPNKYPRPSGRPAHRPIQN